MSTCPVLRRELHNRIAARVMLLLCVAGLLAIVFGAFGCRSWLDASAGTSPAPAGPREPFAQTVTFALPGGSTLTMPAAPTAPQEFDVPGLGHVVITPTTTGAPTPVPGGATPDAPPAVAGAGPGGPPAAGSPAPTNGDLVAQGVGGVVTLLSGGNPLLGVMASSLLAMFLSKRKGTPPTV